MTTDDRKASDERLDIERTGYDDAIESSEDERVVVGDGGESAGDGDGPPDGTAEESKALPGEDLTETELEALHEVELGLEWLQRAQGHLIEFHHATGHGMDHLDSAESMLRESGHTALADDLETTVLPHGVVNGDRWSYDVLESFQDTIHTEIRRFESQVRQELTDGTRHVQERQQERRWKERAREE